MQKITPCLWFENNNSEEAINFYISVFKNSKMVSIKRYPDKPMEGLPMNGLEGKILTAIFELEGQQFMALDGGPLFTFNPTVSFMVNCATPGEVDEYWNKLVEGGSVLMELQKYPFSERYGWLKDKYGVSWQIGVSISTEKITPSLMFVGDKFGKAEEAIEFYTSTFKNSAVEIISRYEAGEHDVPGKVKYSSFILEGQHFSAMESSLGHDFTTSGAISFQVECDSSDELDQYWNRLIEASDPNTQQCGWVQDKYGFSWQIIPKVLGQYLSDPDKEKADRVMKAMLKMKKIDSKALQDAYDGE